MPEIVGFRARKSDLDKLDALVERFSKFADRDGLPGVNRTDIMRKAINDLYAHYLTPESDSEPQHENLP